MNLKNKILKIATILPYSGLLNFLKSQSLKKIVLSMETQSLKII